MSERMVLPPLRWWHMSAIALKPLAIPLFVKQSTQANEKGNIKGHLKRESIGLQGFLLTNWPVYAISPWFGSSECRGRDHLCMRPASERRRYNVTSSLIRRVHAQNEHCMKQNIFIETEMSFFWRTYITGQMTLPFQLGVLYIYIYIYMLYRNPWSQCNCVVLCRWFGTPAL